MKPWPQGGPRVTGAAAAAAEAVARLLGDEPSCVVLFRGDGPAEAFDPGTGCVHLAEAIATGAPAVIRELRAAARPVFLQATALRTAAPALHARLRSEGVSGVAVVPLAGEDAPLGAVLVPWHGSAAPRLDGTPWTAAGETFRALRVAAAAATLRALATAAERGGIPRPDGVVVVDPDERIVLTAGLLGAAPGWGPDDFGRPLAELPGREILRALPGNGIDAPSWEEHLFPPISGKGHPVALAAVPLGPPDGLAAGSRMILAHDLRAGSRRTSVAVALALRTSLAAAALGRAVEEGGGRPLPRGLAGAGELARETGRLCAAVREAARAEPLDLNQLVEEVVERHRDELTRQRVRVFCSLRRPLPPPPADAPEVVFLVDALLRCARASLRGTGGTMTVRSWTEGGWICVAVSDTGGGPDTDAPAPLTQPLHPATGDEGGPGRDELRRLERLVQAVGGQTHVESRPGVWSRYTVMVPAGGPPPPPSTAEQPAASEPSEIPARPLEVLVVDDNAALRSVMRRFLERRGHEVVEANDGEEALRIVESRSFDRLIVDVHMPGTDGPTFFLELARVEPELQSRTIFMTGGTADSETAHLIAQTGRDPLFKPFLLNDAARVIERD